MCVDHYPPLQIIRTNQPVTGESVVVVQRLVQTAGHSLQFTIAPNFGSCLDRMFRGKVDIVSGLLKTPDREPHMHFIEYHHEIDKVFIVDRDWPKIESIQDLSRLKIALAKGVKMYQKFDDRDNDFTIVRYYTLVDAVPDLLAGKIDAIASTRSRAESLIGAKRQYEERLTIAPYYHKSDSALYIGLNKKTISKKVVEALKNTGRQLFETYEFEKEILKFRNDNPQFYWHDS